MPKLKTILSPRAYGYKIKHLIQSFVGKCYPDYRGVFFAEPGHFYSPLIKISDLDADDSELPYDGVDYWENINLRQEDQKALFTRLLPIYKKLTFPKEKTESYNYFSSNNQFPLSDAYLLAALIEYIKPSKILEIGSGFSSGVMIDTIKRINIYTNLTFVEPYPQRLHKVIEDEKLVVEIIANPVQACDLKIFEDLQDGDILFIDSSHVAKIGSDVSHIFLKILPRIKSGVYVHIHDIVYPETYPIEWTREGRAWNESLFLRCFLQYNDAFQIVAFNRYAWKEFPELFIKEKIVDMKNHGGLGGSLWMKRI